MPPGIAVGVITYRRPEALSRCLDSVAAQTLFPAELIVCDDTEDDSTERTVRPQMDLLGGRPIRIEYVRPGSKGGQPKARNEILRRCKSDIIAFVDDDAVCDPRYVETLTAVFADPAVAGCGGPAIEDESRIETDLTEGTNRMTGEGLFLDRSSVWVPPAPVDVDVFLGANMAFRVDALRGAGGFDEAYGAGTAFREETDVMVALRRRGERLVYHPDLRVNHMPAPTGGSRTAARRRWYWTGRNQVYFLRKHFGLRYSNLIAPLLARESTDIPSISLALSMFRRGERQVLWMFPGMLAEIARPRRPGVRPA